VDIRDRLQDTLSSAYTIEKELGGGGMSRVFLAEEKALGRRVVVKVLPHEMAAAVSIDRFRREISLAARLQHPHIVPLLTAGEVDGVPYFTMPYVDGESLRVRLARHGELPIAEGMRILREVASALAYAHGRGVVHRDIKPDNVLLSGGSAMVTDFGVAKALSASSNGEHSGVTSLGVALGTPAYMAPEQASADPALDHRADIYAFGVLAYELISGQTPFVGRTPQGLLAAHVTEVPEMVTRRRANIPPALGALIMRCLEKRPADRPQSADELLHMLDDITTPSGGMQPTSALPATRAPRETRSRWMIAAAVGTMVVVVGIFAVLMSKRGPKQAIASAPQSIAVLPLTNASADTSMKFFAAGMTDELTSALAKISGLRVASRSATDAVGTADAKAAGTKLGVGAVLEGRMRREGDQMALTVQLTNVTDGLSLWSGSYHAQVKDAFAVQDSVARAIAGALKVALTPAQQAGLVRQETKSAKAHDLYLLGRYTQEEYTEPALRKSIKLFEQAIAEDSSYASAWSGIADSWGLLADDYVSPLEAVAPMKAAIARGLAIEPDNPVLHNSLGATAFWYDRDLPKALRELEIAVRADSTVLAGQFYYSIVLWTAGQRDSGEAIVRRRARSSDLSEVEGAATNAYFLHDTALARSICNDLVARDPSLCRALRLKLDHKWAELLAFDRNAEQGVTDTTHRLRVLRLEEAEALARMGRTAEASALVTQVERWTPGRYQREDAFALIWGIIGDADRALSWLERAKKSNSAGIASLYVHWKDLPLRKEPRIAAFIKANAIGTPPPGW
jgi:serine/threonine-protein kinase